jgi:hypothetical protein
MSSSPLQLISGPILTPCCCRRTSARRLTQVPSPRPVGNSWQRGKPKARKAATIIDFTGEQVATSSSAQARARLTPQGSGEREEGVGPSAIVDFSGEEVGSLGARVPSCPRITALANDPIQPPAMVSYCSSHGDRVRPMHSRMHA